MGGVLRARVELSIGKRAGTAEPELNVALGVELRGLVEALDGLGSPGCIVASFDEEGLQARLGESERGEEAGAAGAYDDGARCGQGRDARRGNARVRRDDANAAAVALGHAGEHRVLIDSFGESYAHREHDVHVRFAPGVDGAAPELDVGEVVGETGEEAHGIDEAYGEAALLGGSLREGCANVRDLDHGLSASIHFVANS